jgi:DNA-binding PadR family transcriptional regulator
MGEAPLLWLVSRYSHPSALARHTRDTRLFPALRRLEARGLVRRRHGLYRLTHCGRAELAFALALARLAR